MQQLNAFLAANLHWLIALAVALVLGMQIEKWHAVARRARWRLRQGRGKTGSDRPLLNLVANAPFDASDQLREVMRAEFAPRPLLNRKEARLFAALERIVATETAAWRVMAQVSLGEIMSSPSQSAYRAINSKRVDLLLVDGEGMPLHAIEYQGAGHFAGKTAAARDAVKKEALRRAGIGYLEVQAGDTPAELTSLIRKLARSIDPPS